MGLVTRYGRRWARNDESFSELGKEPKLKGLYILYDGSMPVYVGRGVILSRLEEHRENTTRRRFWDYFSWYEIPNKELLKDAEALLIKTLPYYLHLLNRRNERFVGPRRAKEQPRDKRPEAVEKPKFVTVKKVG
jgi:hypothetical protein